MIDYTRKEFVLNTRIDTRRTFRAGLVLGLFATALWAGAASAYDAGAVANGGSISGTVKYKGTPPARAKLDVNKDTEVCGAGGEKLAKDLVVAPDGAIQYAVVTIPGITKGKPFADAKSVLDQKGCEYAPHIVLVQAGGDLDIQNSDGILHNIHTYSEKNPPLNRAQPKFKKTMTETFKEPEKVRLACDVHGWMQGWLIVENNPYVAITDDKGAFKLTDVPPGDYDVTVWQEKLGESTQKVSVKPGADTAVNFELAGK
jgi:plastocyanin